MSEWISVKERLPEELPENTGRKTISCLVALKSCYPRIGAQRVTHWMPLPEPPEENQQHE
jgi:hypothetical protein